MKSFSKIIIGVVAAGIIVTGVIYLARRERRGFMLTEVSDQGYETAYDILFPRNHKGGSKLHYGPVLPND